MKTNFLNKLKQALFLLIAVLGTFVGFSQSTQSPTIGGSKTPGDTGGLLDIGGRQEPPTTPFGIFAVEIDCTFAFLNETGGGKGTSTDTGQMSALDDLDLTDIGGRDSGGGLKDVAANIGGRGGSDTGPSTIFDIGGRSQDPTILTMKNNNDTSGGHSMPKPPLKLVVPRFARISEVVLKVLTFPIPV